MKPIKKLNFVTSYIVLFALSFLLAILPVVAQTPSQETPILLLQKGKTLYEEGKLSEAITLLQQAAEAFKNYGDQLRQAMTLSNLSLALQQQEKWQEAEQASTESLKLLQSNQDEDKNRLGILAQALEVKAKLLLSTGNPKQALNLWQEAAKIYTKLGHNNSLTKNQINQSLALQDLGHYRQAWTLLNSSLPTIQKQPDSLIKATALRSLGNVLRVVGDVENLDKSLPKFIQVEKGKKLKYLEQSEQLLRESLEISKKERSPIDIGEALLGLGNTARAAYINARDADERVPNSASKSDAENQIQKAIDYYQQAITTTPSKITQIQAELNQLSILLDWGKWKQKSGENTLAEQLSKQADNLPNLLSKINKLPPSRVAVYTRINLAQSLMQLSVSQGKKQEKIDIEQLLNTALEQAQQIEDKHSIAYVLGYLGKWYEQTGRVSEAKNFTEQALLLTENIQAPDIAYQWQWQLGRILKKQGKIKEAITAYEVAIKTLDSLRQDIVSFNKPPDFQFSFRDNVEPVYRELVELLLTNDKNYEPSPKNLSEAIKQIDSLQLAELEDYLRCKIAKSVQIDQFTNPKAAIIYPIILEKQLAVIFKLPGQELSLGYRSTFVNKDDVEKTLKNLRISLTKSGGTPKVKELAKKVYGWIIKPLESDLKKNNQIETLVFVLDGLLRNIPMAALYDGYKEEYLIQKYAVAIAPRLEIFEPKPTPSKLKVFLGGVGLQQEFPEENQNFESIKKLGEEIEGVGKIVNNAKPLLNADFTTTNLQAQLKSGDFSVLHFKTHGVFTSDPEKTFIVAYKQLIKSKDLANLVQIGSKEKVKPIELLVLSACETAKGDNRAVLGLAGIAVRIGTRSTLSTLWKANDEWNTKLMKQFYTELYRPGTTKAKALQLAQLAIFNNEKDPNYWASYILVGNWL